MNTFYILLIIGVVLMLLGFFIRRGISKEEKAGTVETTKNMRLRTIIGYVTMGVGLIVCVVAYFIFYP